MTDRPDHAEDRAPDKDDIARPATDDTMAIRGNRTGDEGHYSGEEAGTYDQDLPDRVAVGANDGGTQADPVARNAGAGIPPEDGRRAHVDRATGEVHGSGSGAGGGQDGEDYDSDSASGSGTEA